jgi:hypothetical protein
MPVLTTLDIVAYEATVELLIDLRKHMREYALNTVLTHLPAAPPPRMSDKTIRARMGKRPHRQGAHRMSRSAPLVTLKLLMYPAQMDAWIAYLKTTPLYGPKNDREYDPTHALDKLVCRGWIAAAQPRKSRARLVSKVA